MVRQRRTKTPKDPGPGGDEKLDESHNGYNADTEQTPARPKQTHKEHLKKAKDKDKDEDEDEGEDLDEEEEDDDDVQVEDSYEISSAMSWFLTKISIIVGIVGAVAIGIAIPSYLYRLHENRLWFSNIMEVEREISFRTESGLYYSYYKQLLEAPSISQGLVDLTQDNVTESWRTINVLERFNVYQEVILAVLYKTLPFVQDHLKPIFFYIDSVFVLHGMYVVALYCTAWLLSGSWMAGVLATAFFIFNKGDSTRVEYTIPLRESFGFPLLYLQIALITYYLKPTTSTRRQLVTLGGILLSSFFFVLSWQFAQFIFLLQAAALYGCTALHMVPPNKVTRLLQVQAVSLILFCILQFFNEMIIGSLVLSFIISALIDIKLQGSKLLPCSIGVRLGRLLLHIIFVLGLAVVINMFIKFAINLDADQHIFKFLLSKFHWGNTRDFDALMYLSNGAFEFLPLDTFTRLTSTLVFPVYATMLISNLVILAIAVFQNWKYYSRQEEAKKDDDTEVPIHQEGTIHLLSHRPELVYHTIQSVFFGIMALAVMRFKFLWTPHMCVLAAVGICEYSVWEAVLAKFGSKSEITVQCVRHMAAIIVFCALLSIVLPDVTAELEKLMEFYDPDTVELMNWINQQTPKTAVFSGSMQLLAGVKLCTGRRLTNHPHYEDKELREMTRKVYQYYGRVGPEEVHAIHKEIGTNYIILEDSICYSRSDPGTRLPDIVDITNQHLYDGATEESEPGLKRPKAPRFCDQIKYELVEYTRHFRKVFENKTFRIYQVL
ncbi:protein C-mannosyl-transferase DPY19L3-like isoform X2 [Amphiura filiformis]|uniref:protein C-mannosyl-transferase DPY19L3-like isoform X2 n=1 Tax=Amphiura filiformis TaxID=82378 RepID=UPI003B20F1CD